MIPSRECVTFIDVQVSTGRACEGTTRLGWSACFTAVARMVLYISTLQALFPQKNKSDHQ
jgi:hypothetical protein